jgi:hypothetical protein
MARGRLWGALYSASPSHGTRPASPCPSGMRRPVALRAAVVFERVEQARPILRAREDANPFSATTSAPRTRGSRPRTRPSGSARTERARHPPSAGRATGRWRAPAASPSPSTRIGRSRRRARFPQRRSSLCAAASTAGRRGAGRETWRPRSRPPDASDARGARARRSEPRRAPTGVAGGRRCGRESRRGVADATSWGADSRGRAGVPSHTARLVRPPDCSHDDGRQIIVLERALSSRSPRRRARDHGRAAVRIPAPSDRAGRATASVILGSCERRSARRVILAVVVVESFNEEAAPFDDAELNREKSS